MRSAVYHLSESVINGCPVSVVVPNRVITAQVNAELIGRIHLVCAGSRVNFNRMTSGNDHSWKFPSISVKVSDSVALYVQGPGRNIAYPQILSIYIVIVVAWCIGMKARQSS